jgi:DNA-binding transcriptional ArsR family regulator
LHALDPVASALRGKFTMTRDMSNHLFRGKPGRTGGGHLDRMPARRGRGIELLVDPTRRQIISLLAKHAMRSGEIASAIDRSRPTATYHLRLLQRAGLIVRTWSRVDYRGRTYFVNPAMLRPITAWLAGVDLPGSPSWRPPPNDVPPAE